MTAYIEFMYYLYTFEIKQRKYHQMFKKSNINIRNKRATFDYEIMERFVAGIQLFGTEIKSIRDGKASLSDTFCTFINNELWVRNMHIASYFFGSYNNHEVKRDRKLLLNKRELRKLVRATKEAGFTIVPTKMFINDRGLAKLEIGRARGKKNYDKRQSLKEKEDKRSIARAMRQ